MQAERSFPILPGRPYPLGATVQDEGINFSVFSAHASSVQLLLFDHYAQETPTYCITLDSQRNHTYYYWHCFIPGLKDGQLYAYRVHGPYSPEKGLRFNGHKVLLDPYAARWPMARTGRARMLWALAITPPARSKSVVVDLARL